MALTNSMLVIDGKVVSGVSGGSASADIIAVEFNAASTYAAGDYVIYDDTLYKFTASKSAGAWDSTKVESTIVADELTDKADKVTSATNNNLAALDASGNLKDSGYSVSDLQTPATTAVAGLVKPDGTSILVDASGTISASVNLSNYIEKSATEGLVKNDGTIDESTFVRLKFGLTGNISAKTWNVDIQFSNKIWTDGENIYYSYNGAQYVLDKATSTWSAKTWTGLTIFNGQDVWTDGDNTYYSSYKQQWVLDKSTSTWSTKTWNNQPDGNDFYGSYTWTDGDNVYYSKSSSQYVLNKSTSTWSAKSWTGLTSFYNSSIWTDGDNIYYSSNSNQYVLDKSTSTWSAKTWNITINDGSCIWTDGTNIYYSAGNTHYVLNKSTGTWSTKTWTGLTSFYGSNLWTDGENVYYSSSSNNYVFDSVNENTNGLVKSDGTIDTNTYVQASDLSNYIEKSATEGLVMNDGSIDTSKHVHLQPTGYSGLTGEVQAKTWNGYTPSGGQYIWTDGENIYYSQNNNQYVLDKSTSTWNTKSWNSSIYPHGTYIWTDKENIYYSNSNLQYVLDKTTSTWSEKTWSGLTNFDGNRIWTDGENIYYSSSSTQYVLNKSNSTWSAKTWTGLTSFSGSSIWTDGDNIYYSNYNTQYVLDKTTSTWSTKTWSGLTNFRGDRIWTDGENIYYSNGEDQYVLNKSTSTWSAKSWTGLTSFSGNYIWTDGDNIYYSDSDNNAQYVFVSEDIYADGFVKTDGSIDTNTYAQTSDLPSAATSSALGLVKPDNSTITVDANGVIRSSYTGLVKTHYTITATNWSNSADASGYYTYTVTLSPSLDTTYPPNVYISGADANTFPTDTEKTQYGYLEECNLTASTTLVLYAKTKPDSTFYVYIEGQVLYT